ncbi:MAG: hypothetical protein D6786_03445 [Gammaproteobacteria bacterium]|nr:MAG: hypothetical protein D6786_03445 [Gammaproteobacteria bacterium]
MLLACTLGGTVAPAAAGGRDGDHFSLPVPVGITGLPAGAGGQPISTEEPFVSRDGRYLFFNSGHLEGNKDLHYAAREAGHWVYRGEIGPSVNTPGGVQGNPTMDADGNFYFIDTTVSHMARGGRFRPDSGTLEGLHELDFLPDRRIRPFRRLLAGNMGVEVSADGNTLYFSRATWKLNRMAPVRIVASDILLARRGHGRWTFDEAQARRLLQHVNSDDLEYAACISRDGLELFFTRLYGASLGEGRPRSAILRAVRPSCQVPFGRPVEVRSIGHDGFVEAPTLGPDEQDLYFHRKVGRKFRLFRVSRRPR